jgi:hypothetical protein
VATFLDLPDLVGWRCPSSLSHTSGWARVRFIEIKVLMKVATARLASIGFGRIAFWTDGDGKRVTT